MAGKEIKLEEKEINIIWRARKRIWCGLPWTFTIYSLSEDRLFIKSGMLNIREDEVRLYRIRDIGLTASFLQRIFGMASIQICSTDSSLGDFELKNIKNARAVMGKISDLVEEERQRKRVSTREILDHKGPEQMDESEEFHYEEEV